VADRPAAALCPDCGWPLPDVKVTRSTIPVEMVALCGNPDCHARDKWAEHYDGDILRLPTVRLGDESDA